jgi:hypothetical protein
VVTGDRGATMESYLSESRISPQQPFNLGTVSTARSQVATACGWQERQPALTRELRLLERRTTRSGKDSVDHGTGGADDHANSLFAALHQLAAETSADGWIKFYGDQAKRAHAPGSAPAAPKENVRPWQTPSQAVDQARKQGNELTEIYTKIRLGIEGVHLATCAACCVELRGHRVTDGYYGWCSASCERAWHAGKRAAA